MKTEILNVEDLLNLNNDEKTENAIKENVKQANKEIDMFNYEIKRNERDPECIDVKTIANTYSVFPDAAKIFKRKYYKWIELKEGSYSYEKVKAAVLEFLKTEGE